MTFILQLKKIPGALLLGEATFGYSPYGEITRFKLPSGHGSLHLPAAIYSTTQAPRAPVTPDFYYPDDMGNESELRQWIVNTLREIRQPEGQLQ